MTTVFVSGSRKISRLNQEINERLANMIDKGLSVVVGDANGADKAFQIFFAQHGYQNVIVYCSGDMCRNNVGQWEINPVKVDKNLKGRDFYTQKDKVMAQRADYGMVLWDGKSAGSISNVLEMLKQNKPVVVYFSPDKEFFNLQTLQDAEELLNRCEKEDVSAISKKINMEEFFNFLNPIHQMAFAL